MNTRRQKLAIHLCKPEPVIRSARPPRLTMPPRHDRLIRRVHAVLALVGLLGLFWWLGNFIANRMPPVFTGVTRGSMARAYQQAMDSIGGDK